MNLTLYNAAMTALRASAMESLALLELYIKNPTAVPDHSSVVTEVKKHARSLAENEAAARSLQQYFQPQKAPQPAAPAPSKPITESDLMERSPTFRKSQGGSARPADPAAEESPTGEKDNGV
tara:strand:+ start:7288 stop:7653 length:366 start_codon:yes stop_codon:yes gene_type:complete